MTPNLHSWSAPSAWTTVFWHGLSSSWSPPDGNWWCYKRQRHLH